MIFILMSSVQLIVDNAMDQLT